MYVSKATEADMAEKRICTESLLRGRGVYTRPDKLSSRFCLFFSADRRPRQMLHNTHIRQGKSRQFV